MSISMDAVPEADDERSEGARAITSSTDEPKVGESSVDAVHYSSSDTASQYLGGTTIQRSIRSSAAQISPKNITQDAEFILDRKIAQYLSSGQMPFELSYVYKDAVILFADQDIKSVKTFQSELQNNIIPKPKIDLISSLNLTFGNVFKALEFAMERATFIFLFITQEFVEDNWSEFSSETCLKQAIEDPLKRWSVVPIYTDDRKSVSYKIPIHLTTLKGLNYSPREPKFYLESVKKLFEDRLYHRLGKEEKHKEKLIEWILKKEEMEAKKRLANEKKMNRLLYESVYNNQVSFKEEIANIIANNQEKNTVLLPNPISSALEEKKMLEITNNQSKLAMKNEAVYSSKNEVASPDIEIDYTEHISSVTPSDGTPQSDTPSGGTPQSDTPSGGNQQSDTPSGGMLQSVMRHGNTEQTDMPSSDGTQQSDMPSSGGTQQSDMPSSGGTQQSDMPSGGTRQSHMPSSDGTQQSDMPSSSGTKQSDIPSCGTRQSYIPSDGTQQSNTPSGAIMEIHHHHYQPVNIYGKYVQSGSYNKLIVDGQFIDMEDQEQVSDQDNVKPYDLKKPYDDEDDDETCLEEKDIEDMWTKCNISVKHDKDDDDGDNDDGTIVKQFDEENQS